MGLRGPKHGAKYSKTRARQAKIRELIDAAKLEGLEEPLAILMQVLNDAWRAYLVGGRQSATLRKQIAWLAAETAPYVHPRLAAIQSTVTQDTTITLVSDRPMSIEEWEAEIQRSDGFRGPHLPSADEKTH